MRTRTAHPASRPLPFRSLQELRRHLNCCFQLFIFLSYLVTRRKSRLVRFEKIGFDQDSARNNDGGNCRLIPLSML